MKIAPSTSPTEQISAVTGCFVDPVLEDAFRLRAWPEWSSRLRIVVLLASGLVLGFGYTDYLELGLGPTLYLCWASRLSVFLAAIAVAALAAGPPRIGALDAATFALLVLFGLSLFIVVGLQQKAVTAEMSGTVLMVLGYYLFVPTRFEIQLACALFVTVGFLLVAGALLAPTESDLTTAGIELLICNVLGAFTAVRTHLLQRREFASQGQVRRRARFEELLAQLSTRFITLPPEAMEQAIDGALAEIGEFTGVDRTYVFEFDSERKLLSCAHEWRRAGVVESLRGMQDIPYDRFSWGLNELLAGRALKAESPEAFTDEAAAERAEMVRLGVRSLLVLPLVHGQRVLGAIGFHAMRTTAWDEEKTAALRMVGEMIIGAIIHRRTTVALRDQARTLEASVAALEKSNADLQRFAYVASHDLQEPLRSISSFSSLLSRRYAGRLDDKADQYIGYLTSAAERMHAMIRDLLDYSRLDAGARAFVRCDPGAIAAKALENLHAAVEAAGATVSIGPLPEVDGDPAQLQQLFQNLIGNALKFHDSAPPVVSLLAERHGGDWVFSVADNGIGIEPRHMQQVFTIFTRLHSADRYPGTGIGLAACRRIVERHRGRIWVEPNVPRGCVFRFTLPAPG